MELLRTWIYGICISAIIISLIKAITPENISGKCVELVSAIIIIIAVVTPIKQVKFTNTHISSHDYQEQVEELTKELERENEKLKTCIIEENISTYLFDMAKEEGLNPISVSVKTERTEMGMEYPAYADIITSSVPDAEKKNRIINKIADDLGIDTENIRIRRKNETYS